MMKFMMKKKTASKAAKAVLLLAAVGIVAYAVMEMMKEKPMTATTTMTTVGAARFPPSPSVSRPISTPTMLASKNGLGGGAYVGSQSLKLGGSSFKPGRKVTYRDGHFSQYQPWPLYKPPAPAAPTPETAAIPDAPVAPATSDAPVAPASAAPLGASNGMKGRRSSAPFGGSAVTRARAPTDIVIETRDGYIVQPRA